MNSPLISIIVPVYQVKPYLSDCLNSIMMQTLTDWEMLLVDDGSNDGSEAVCDEYASKDSRIRVFHQENAGLSAARNTALNHARGSFYTMVDSDDLLSTNDYLQNLYDALIENDAEMSVCGHIEFDDGTKPPRIALVDKPSVYVCTGREFYSQNRTKEFYYSSADAKLYRKELFENIRYPVGHVYEDVATQHRISFNCRRIACINESLYAYRQRQSSLRGNTLGRGSATPDYVYALHDRIVFFSELGDSEMVHLAEQNLLIVLNYRKNHCI